MSYHGEIVWASDEENFTHDSMYEALENCVGWVNGEAIPPEVGTVLYFGEAVAPNVSKLVDSDDIIDMLRDRAYDNYGEWAENFADLSKNDKKDKKAIDKLDKFLQKWITENCPVTFYTVKNVQQYVVTHEDVDEWIKENS